MATLADVAKHAGVAASTVSYVLSGKRSVSPATKLRVERSIELLNYHPHAGARALASSRANVIALIVPLRTDLYVPVMMEIAISVTTTARKYGQDVLLLTNDEGPEGIHRVAVSSRADSMILMDVSMDDDRIPLLRTVGIDAVLIGIPSDTAGLSCIDLDFNAAGALCVSHLAELGHKEIAFIGEAEAVYQRHSGFAVRTLRGVQDTTARLGLRLIQRPTGNSHEAAAGAVMRILEERPQTTGLIVQNESIISPLLSVLRTLGKAVPEDISVVAICPDQVAVATSPRLTSITIPSETMGQRAVEMLMRGGENGHRPEVIRLPPELTMRGSTAPAPANH